MERSEVGGKRNEKEEGERILVASVLPPMPTSIIQASNFEVSNTLKARSVINLQP